MASVAELRMMTEWAAEEGWNPGDDDRVAFAAADPFGFLVGRVDGTPVSCVSVVRYGDGFGFLGFYITRAPWRGQGYGLQTWQAGMARMRGRNVGLDGVVEQQANYRKSGFRPVWKNLRYEGIPASGAQDVTGIVFTDALTLPLELLHRYDRRFFPADRRAFLAGWLALPGRVAIAALKDGALAGLGVVRPCRAASRVGPLYAQTPEIAAALLMRLSAGEPIALDVPDVNPHANPMAEELGLKPAFESARMYTGSTPQVDTAAFYGVTSLELG